MTGTVADLASRDERRPTLRRRGICRGGPPSIGWPPKPAIRSLEAAMKSATKSSNLVRSNRRKAKLKAKRRRQRARA
jgi:hypothetical protein